MPNLAHDLATEIDALDDRIKSTQEHLWWLDYCDTGSASTRAYADASAKLAGLSVTRAKLAKELAQQDDDGEYGEYYS